MKKIVGDKNSYIDHDALLGDNGTNIPYHQF